MTRQTKSRLRRARRSPFVLFSAALPVLYAALPAIQDALPILRDVMSPTTYFLAIVAVSTAGVVLHLRETDKAGE